MLAGLACSNPLGLDDLMGTWGAETTKLVITSSAATFETPCLGGTLRVPIQFDGDRGFETIGTVVHSGGAPPIYPPVPQEVTFVGEVKRDLLTLSILPESPGRGPYELRRGVTVDVPGCP